MSLRSAARRALTAFAAILSFSSGLAIAPLSAQEPASSTLIPGKGSALTMAKCAICHDITHVTRSRLTRDEWDDNIKVMIARGMPIEAHEIPVVLDYLATYYNRDKPPPPPDPASAAGPATVERSLADHGCIACHTRDTKVVGPAFRDIAARYKDDPAAAALLMKKVREGGSGVYGDVPMPPHPQISEDDLRGVVDWILAQQ